MANLGEANIGGRMVPAWLVRLTAGELDGLKWHSNRNLLDNAYWANPDAIIDQRGGYVVPSGTAYYSDTGLTTQAGAVSAYTKVAKVNGTYGTITVSGTTYYVEWSAAVRGYTGAGYTIDRWHITSGMTVLIDQDGTITLKNIGSSTERFAQIIGEMTSEPHTLSVLVKSITGGAGMYLQEIEGAWHTPITKGLSVGMNYKTGTPNAGVSYQCIFTLSAGATIKFSAAKLELGTVQTLAHQDENGNWVLNDPPPDKGEELLKCQRYYQIFATQSMRPTDKDDFRPPMRVTPALGTININGKTYYTADANL